MDNNPVKLVDFESSSLIPFHPFIKSSSNPFIAIKNDNDDRNDDKNDDDDKNDKNDKNDMSLLSPWNHIVLSPCLIGFGEHDYLCYPNACSNQVRIVDIHTGEIVNCLAGHIDYPICCCYRETLCEL